MGDRIFSDYVFNFIGPLCVSLLLLSYYRFPVFEPRFLLNAIAYPIVIVWIYCFVSTPDLNTLELTTDANQLTTGGFGSNQVSTALGIAMFVIYYFLHKKINFSGFRSLDYLILFGISFQALISFSRGGVLGALIAIVALLIFDTKSGLISRRFFNVIFIAIVLTGSFIAVNNLTDGLIMDRFQGRSAGVKAGSKENDLENLTSGRYGIFLDDIKQWSENPVTGVGVGNSSRLRTIAPGHIAHSEISRLLSEQGVFGGLFFLFWIYVMYRSYKYQPGTLGRVLVLSFSLLAIFTTFHAAMRTFATPLLSAMAVVTFKQKK